jgi:hypothetical protein
MCRDNELWRQHCFERWDKNPKESDCAKNWLIPVREGGGTKENRIDWRRCYIIRSLHVQATKFLNKAEKKQRLGFLKRKNAKKTKPNTSDFFAKGWPTVKDLLKFETQIPIELARVEEELDGSDYDDANYPDYVALMSLFIELELLIVRRFNISREEYLGIGGRFVGFIAEAQFKTNDVPARIAKYAAQYVQLAQEKDVPADAVAEFLGHMASVFIGMIGTVALPIDFYSVHLVQFIATIITAMTRPLQDGLKQWTEDEELDESPTNNFESTLDAISEASINCTEMGMPLFFSAINRALAPINSNSKSITKLAVISAVAPACEEYITDNLKSLMTNHVLPFWKSSEDAEYLVPLVYFVSIILSEQDRIQQEYAADLIPPLFEMAKHENQNVKREVADFVIAFCENLSDPDPLVPYLSDLLDVMYGYLKCESSSVRSKATTAISSLIITCSTSFMKHKDRVMAEFKNLLNGSESDRQSAIEALTRMGAGIGEQRTFIESDIEVLYEQLVENCKRDRTTHLDMLLKMTVFAVVSLGPKFSKFSSYVLPLVLENIQITVTENKAEDSDEQMADALSDEDLEMLDIEAEISFSEQAVLRKKSALEALGQIIFVLEREIFLSDYMEVGMALLHCVTNPAQHIPDTMKLAWGAYTDYIKKLFVKEDPQWANTQQMSHWWGNSAKMLAASAGEIQITEVKSYYVFLLTNLFKHFCALGTPEQPFLTKQVMQHLNIEVFSVLCAAYYEFEAAEVHFNELQPFASQVAEFLKAVCETRTDNEIFWTFAEPILGSVMAKLEEPGRVEYRWFDVSLLCVVFEKFGREFLEGNRVRANNKRNILVDSLVYSVSHAKYPIVIQANEEMNYLLSSLESVLVGDGCKRESDPVAYDNALMLMSGVLLYVAKTIEPEPEFMDLARTCLVKYVPILTRALPPAKNGNLKEARVCFERYTLLVQITKDFLGNVGDVLENDTKRALKETMEMLIKE